MKTTSYAEANSIIQDKYIHLFDVYFEFRNELIMINNNFKNYDKGKDYLQTLYQKHGNFSSVDIEVIGYKFKTKNITILSHSPYYGSFWTPQKCLEVFESSPRIWTEQDIKNKYHSDDKKWIKNNRKFREEKL